MSIRPFGDRALLVELEQRIDPALVDRARGIADAWEARGHGPAIPAYASVVLQFDPQRLGPDDAAREAAALLDAPPSAAHGPGRLVELPTTYDGPDLADVAARSGLSPAALIAAHSGIEYRAFFLGFMPGLAYCGLLDPRIVAPRLASPRTRVPAGSVAVANGQTVVYPFDSPGGWRLIGRTATPLFDPTADPPARIAAGDRVRFVPR